MHGSPNQPFAYHVPLRELPVLSTRVEQANAQRARIAQQAPEFFITLCDGNDVLVWSPTNRQMEIICTIQTDHGSD
jgi:hypothetical protein